MSAGRVTRESAYDEYESIIPLYNAACLIATDRTGGIPDKDGRKTATWAEYFSQLDAAYTDLASGCVVKTSKATYKLIERKRDVHLSCAPRDSSGCVPDGDSRADHRAQVV